VAAILVHIDLDGDRPHPASLIALGAGRAVASSWGATLYAALVFHDAPDRMPADTTPPAGIPMATARRVPGLEAVQSAIARGGADKLVIALCETPVSPLWATVGAAWQAVLDRLRPRLVLFGSDAPSAAELGPRTGARIGARLLSRARAVGGDQIELRDRDGGYVRASDGGAAVAMIGAGSTIARGDAEVELVVLPASGGHDARVELAGAAPAELAHLCGTIIAIGDDVANDPEVVAGAKRLARLLGAHVVGGQAAARAGAVGPGAIVERHTPLAPELCISVGTSPLDLAGAASTVRIGASPTKSADGALAGTPGASLVDLVRTLEAS
jgi:hypothetical protein